MSAKVIPFTDQKKQLKQVVAEVLEKNLSHKNPQVLNCLQGEVEKLLGKHFSADAPEMALPLPSDLSAAQFQKIRKSFRQVFTEYNEQMIQRSNSIFLDLYLSRLEVCELKYGSNELI